MENLFTAPELYCMARLAGKRRMFGIPDVLAGISKDEQPSIIRHYCDELVQRGIAALDIDGNIRLVEEYRNIPNIYSDCDYCMTITRQAESGENKAYAFWKKAGKIHMAESVGEGYLITESNQKEVRSCCGIDIAAADDDTEVIAQSTPIPQIALVKAKRAAMSGERDRVIRILRENGADQQLAGILCRGLEEKADYVGLLLMKAAGEKVETQEVAWLQRNGVTLTAHKEVINYRTCIAFERTPAAGLAAKAEAIVETFLYS